MPANDFVNSFELEVDDNDSISKQKENHESNIIPAHKRTKSQNPSIAAFQATKQSTKSNYSNYNNNFNTVTEPINNTNTNTNTNTIYYNQINFTSDLRSKSPLLNKSLSMNKPKSKSKSNTSISSFI